MDMRVQGRFRYFMNDAPPPADSPLMKSYLAYFLGLSKGAPIGAVLEGAGFATLADPELAPDVARVEAADAQWCAACHGEAGQGLRDAASVGWVVPPFRGPESYNWGAGMHQINKAAAFIKKDMPYGLQDVLTDQVSWDIAEFMNSPERPQDPRYDGDLAQTAEKHHDGKYDLYGKDVHGVVLGAHAYSAGRAPLGADAGP